MSLKIGPIVDRAPVRLAVVLPLNTHDALADYARIHAREFGGEISLGDLAALMIDRFLQSDAAFRRARKSLHQPKAATE
ncbi:MAG: DUF2274 domain-containing protein [Parvularculaceae bacterium]